MELNIINAEEYNRICREYQYFYNSMFFHQLNEEKTDKVVFLSFGNKKKKLALAAGIRKRELLVPYSAPFGIFEKIQKHIGIEEIESTLELLEEYGKENNIFSITFRLPPAFYDESFISKCQNSMLRVGYQIVSYDLNYQIFMKNMEKYEKSLWSTARQNLKIAMKQEYWFLHCETIDEKMRAYNVIAKNRKRKGYPLRMTCEQVMETIQLVEHDFFLLCDKEIDVASAIIYKVNKHVYQLIYWGDIDGYESNKPMNYLAYKIYEFYLKMGIEVLDIGPATEDGMPNYGLCSFKESIGCDVSCKVTYRKVFSGGS